MRRIILLIIVVCVLAGAWFAYTEIYTAEAQKVGKIEFQIHKGETVSEIASRLEKEQIIRNAWLFQKYLVLRGIDDEINYGEFEIEAPITTKQVADALGKPGLNEQEITIIPGWTLRDIAHYLENKGIFQAEELTELAGLPAHSYKGNRSNSPIVNIDLKVLEGKPWFVSYEGYLAPETYRLFNDATIEDIVKKLMEQRDKEFTDKMYDDIKKQGRTVYDVLTMASLLEREVQTKEDRAEVADIFWKRYDAGWALQADSSVHYAVGKTGDIFTTEEDRNSLSPWNTYKYPGLPIGPISNPSLDSIMAAIYPKENDYWYFLTTLEGEVKYAETLDEHNMYVNRYLR